MSLGSRRLLVGAAVVIAVGALAGCSKSTNSASPATTAPTTTQAKAGTGGGDSGSGSGGSGDNKTAGDNGGNGGGGGNNGGGGGSGNTQIGLSPADAEQLRTIYINKGVPAETADCIVSATVAALQGTAVTQDNLVAALADAAARCGATSSAGGGGGGDIVKGIIDNYPTGGAPVSSTIVSGGGQSPIDNFPTGG